MWIEDLVDVDQRLIGVRWDKGADIDQFLHHFKLHNRARGELDWPHRAKDAVLENCSDAPEPATGPRRIARSTWPLPARLP
jgi:hypothetical protein